MHLTGVDHLPGCKRREPSAVCTGCRWPRGKETKLQTSRPPVQTATQCGVAAADTHDFWDHLQTRQQNLSVRKEDHLRVEKWRRCSEMTLAKLKLHPLSLGQAVFAKRCRGLQAQSPLRHRTLSSRKLNCLCLRVNVPMRISEGSAAPPKPEAAKPAQTQKVAGMTPGVLH